MPNNKILGDCTFGEIAVIGGAYTRLAACGQPDQRVRDVLSADQVQTVLSDTGE